MSKPVSLLQFEVFLSITEHGSFTEAAKSLNLSKAALSKTIKALEKELELSLFIRTTRSLKLTEEGKLLYQQCLRLKEELDSVRHLVGRFHSEPRGHLRISCNLFWAEKYLLPKLELYMKKFPQIEIDLLSEERLPDLKRENIDLVFGVNWPAPDNVIARKIGETRYVLCASPDYLKRFGTPTCLNDLEQHQYIPHLGREHHTPIVSLKKTTSKIHLKHQLKTNHSHLIKACALQGLGIVELHDYVVADEIEKGNLIEILPGILKEKEPIYIYYRKDGFVLPKVRQLINLLTNNE